MGGIWANGIEFVGSLADLVGYKLGIAVTQSELQEAFKRAGLSYAWPDPMNATYRYRSEDYERTVRAVLSQFGDPNAIDAGVPPVVAVLRSLPKREREVAKAAVDDTIALLPELIATTPDGGALDPTSLLKTIAGRHGLTGAVVARKLLRRINANLYASPWARVRREEWPDLVVLNNLFATEESTATLGRFFDQRFIDYLDTNFDDIDEINWRRFEALVAEYLERDEWVVELGPGRADDGIDIRLWRPDAAGQGPVTVLVQCKRERKKISKTVVKALAADVIWHGAEAGLLVTTSAWFPGTRTVAETRDYPVLEGDRGTVRTWVRTMRTPGTGVWLGE